jgi:hypothetical protein
MWRGVVDSTFLAPQKVKIFFFVPGPFKNLELAAFSDLAG